MSQPRLTSGEIEILKTLWGTDGLSICEVQRALDKSIGYTTVQTRLNRLVAKGYVQKTDLRPAKYRAQLSQQAVTQNDLDMLINQVNRGQVIPLVAQLIDQQPLTDAEIAEIQLLLKEAAAKRTSKQKNAE